MELFIAVVTLIFSDALIRIFKSSSLQMENTPLGSFVIKFYLLLVN